MAKQTDSNPLTISPDKAANKLGVAPNIVRNMIYSGELPAIQVGRRWLIPVKSLEAWIDKRVKLAAGE